MRAKYPDVENEFDFRATPDYSPRVPRVRLPAHVRERGQEFVSRHVLGRRDWEIADGFHCLEIVLPSPRSRDAEPIGMGGADLWDEILLSRPKSTPVNVKVVAREAPPFVFIDEAECEDEILLPPPHRTPVNVKIGFSGRPTFVFRDEFEDEAL